MFAFFITYEDGNNRQEYSAGYTFYLKISIDMLKVKMFNIFRTQCIPMWPDVEEIEEIFESKQLYWYVTHIVRLI